MTYPHDPIFDGGGCGTMHCSRCGAKPGTLSYLHACTVPPKPVEQPSSDFGQSLSNSLNESPFDRIDRMFRSKKS